MDLSSENATATTVSNSSLKLECAEECLCRVPVIPAPEQWLEVMVTGGFKVWHIIFIVIFSVVTLIVVYCCFHRCRIPRTKQEIEADLMRTNLAKKFTEYLQELPSEPTTFIEALKKVQDLAEKVEQQSQDLTRDPGSAQKRMGWLKQGKEDPNTRAVNDFVHNSYDFTNSAFANDQQPSEATFPSTVADLEMAYVLESASNTLAAELEHLPQNSQLPVALKLADTKIRPPHLEISVERPPNERSIEQPMIKPTKTTRRHRHKPSLSRTKARDKSHSSQPEPTVKPSERQTNLELPSSNNHSHSTHRRAHHRHNTAPKNVAIAFSSNETGE